MSKTATHLTGILKHPGQPLKLKRTYNKILMLLSKLPKNANYRINTEAIICQRLSVINEAGNDLREIEDNICCGNIHLLMIQAEDEYLLVQKMLVWKPWERPVEQPPPMQWDWPPAQI